MMLAGMDVARLNFSHSTRKSHAEKIKTIRVLNKKYRRKIKILGDLKGNRIRIGKISPLQIKKHETVYLTRARIKNKMIPFDYAGKMNAIKKGHEIFIDDGAINLRAEEIFKNSVKTKVIVGGIVKEHKGVNIPSAKLDFPLLSVEDIKDIYFAAKNKLDYIAHSFVRSGKEVKEVRKILQSLKYKSNLISKIEAREAVENLDEIIALSDIIMIARGDMGISFPVWEVPFLQKKIIAKCRAAKKPVITATQMLESMTENFLPTRAEVSDVANAILDGTDYVMLSGETAAGRYPVKSVKIMNEIIKRSEKHLRQ